MNKSISHNRAVKSYLSPKNYALLKGYVNYSGLTTSDAINTIVKDFVCRLTETQRQMYLSAWQEDKSGLDK